MARKPGGVVSRTVAKTIAAAAIGTDQLHGEQNIVMRLCGKRVRRFRVTGRCRPPLRGSIAKILFLHCFAREPRSGGSKRGPVYPNQVIDGQGGTGDGSRGE